MVREYIESEDLLNTGRKKLNRSIDKSYDAEETSVQALKDANTLGNQAIADANKLGNEAKQISTEKGNESIAIAKENEKVAGEANLIAKDTNERMNQIIAGTTDSAEVIDSRKPVGLEAAETLGERLNLQFGNNEDFRPEEVSLVRKMKNQFENTYVDSSWFCVGDGIVDDTEGLKTAVKKALDIKTKLFIPYSQKIRITSTIDMSGIFIESLGEIIVDFNGIGVILGHVAAQSHGRESYIRTVIHKSFKQGDISIRIQGAKRLNFKFWDLEVLQLYADGDIPQISSSAYNIITLLGYIKRFEIYSNIESIEQGWINENTIIKGKFRDILIDGNYTHNKNTFVDSCIEGASVKIINGSSNHFTTARNENVKEIFFGENTYRNSIQYAYYSSNGILSYSNVVDNGTGNAVYSVDEFMPSVKVLELTHLNVGKSSAVVKEALNINENLIDVKPWQKFIRFTLDIKSLYKLECILNESNNFGIRYYLMALDENETPILDGDVLWIGGSSFNNETGIYTVSNDVKDFKMLVNKPSKAKKILIEVGSSKHLEIKRILFTAKTSVSNLSLLEAIKPIY